MRLIALARRSRPFSAGWGSLQKCFYSASSLHHISYQKALHRDRFYTTSATDRVCASDSVGLFGLKDLQSPGDFEVMSKRAILRCDEIRSILSTTLEKVESGECPPSADILMLLDSISNEVCSVIDVAELCRNVHEDADFRLSAERAFSHLSAYIHELNTDATLYRSLMTLVDDNNMWASLSEEQRRVAEDLKKEFEADGIHKQGSATAVEISRLQSQLVETESVFMQNISSAVDAPFKVGPFEDAQYGAQIKRWMAQFAAQDNEVPLVPVSDSEQDGAEDKKGVYAVCSARRAVTRGVVSSVSDPRVREQAWRGGLPHPASNQAVLGKLVKTRQALARELGYDSWAEKVLLSSAAGDPADVWRFLENAADSVRAPAEAMMGELASLRGHAGHGPSALGMAPWDVSYYSHAHTALLAQRRSSRRHQDSARSWRQEGAADPSQLFGEYFTLSVAMEALQDLTEQLFGIHLRVVPLGSEEAWVGDRGSGLSGVFRPRPPRSAGDLGAKSVAEVMRSIGNQPYKLEVSSKDGISLGEVLIDLYQRPNKFTGAAHFTVRCGCSVLGDYQYQQIKTSLAGSGGIGGSSRAIVEDVSVSASRQLPLVALVFNFPPPSAGLMDSLGPPTEPQLTLGDMSTLFHEWGHALHSLLSRTTYQHLSGTRGTLDFVEVPSHLFEYFASEPSLLQRWGRHYASGSSAPEGLFEEMVEQRRSTEILEVQGQLLYALCDQYAFGAGIGNLSAASEEETFLRVVEGAAALQKKHTPAILLASDIGGDKSTRTDLGLPDLHLTNHSHFVTYGGSYYSYLFAKMYAAQIWNLRFKGDPLNQTSGQALLEGLLMYGVSRPPRDLLQGICHGQALDPEYYFAEITPPG